MPNTCRKQLSYKNAEVLGLYGQNGSGKTAIIDTLYYLQKIMVGDTLVKEIADYINVKCDQAEIVANFIIFKESVIYVIVLEEHKNKTTNGKLAHKYPACLIGRNNQRYIEGWLVRQLQVRDRFSVSFQSGPP